MAENVSCIRLPNESFDDFFVRICENKNVLGLTFEQVADILNAESGKSLGESAWRKRWKNFHQGRLYERKHIGNNMLMEQTRELEKQRIRIADERAALKRIVRDEARKDAVIDELKEQFAKMVTLPSSAVREIHPMTEGTILVVLSDWHIGMNFDSPYGKYNTEIATQYIYEYAEAVKEAAKTYKARNCFVVFAGDMISGIIHNTIRVANREELVSQVKIAAELSSVFINSISKSFEYIEVRNIGGNHSRVSDKDDAMLGEMLDDIIPFYVKARIGDAPNVKVCERKYDTGFESFFIGNQHVLLVHGEFDNMNEVSIAKLERITGAPIDVLISAHLHENMFVDIGGAHVIRGGCLPGSGDEYTLKKRLYCPPSQTMAYFDAKNTFKAVLPVYF